MNIRLLIPGIILFLAASYQTNAQCELPQLEDWHFTDTSSVELLIDNSADIETLVVLFELMIDDGNSSPGPLSSDTVITDINEGDQIFNHIISYPGFELIPPENQYHAITLGAICQGDTLLGARDYVAYSSLLTSSSFDPGEYFMKPVLYLLDGDGFTQSLFFNLDTVSAAETVQDLNVFLDISHSFLGDLDIELVSPSQDTVKLMDFGNNNLGSSNVLSVVFDDEAIEGPPYGGYLIDQRLTGNYQPEGDLEYFDGQPISGQWELIIEDNLLIDNGYFFGASLIFNDDGGTAGCTGPVIAGSAFLDYNENGERDEEEPLAQGFVEVNSLDSTWFNYSEGSYGVYNVCAPSGTNQIIFSEGYQLFEPLEDTITITAAWPDTIGDANFPLQPVGEGFDMSISGVSHPFLSGFEQDFHFQYFNQGADCAEGVTVEVVFPEEIDLIEASNGGTISDNTIEWDLGEVCPGLESSVAVTTYCPTSLLGETLLIESSVEGTGEDLYTENNNHLMWENVIGSYDPNDIQVDRDTVSPSQAAGETALNYRVRFQNTGTAPAQTVEIENEIDDLLHLETIQVTGTSHDMSVEVEDNLVTFVFDEINLPDSSLSQEESQGYVTYRIYPTAEFIDDAVIENSAAIFFDFNEPIYTNTAETRILDVSSVGNPIAGNSMRVFPNPAGDVLSINNIDVGIQRLVLYDLSGRAIMEVPVQNRSRLDLDVSTLGEGMYMLTDSEGISHVKFVIE